MDDMLFHGCCVGWMRRRVVCDESLLPTHRRGSKGMFFFPCILRYPFKHMGNKTSTATKYLWTVIVISATFADDPYLTSSIQNLKIDMVKGFWYWFRAASQYGSLRATLHTSQEPWPWNCESPKGNYPKAVSRHLQSHVLWSRSLSVVWSHTCSGLQPNAKSMNFYSYGSSHILK